MTTKTDEQLRDAFEAWAKTHYYLSELGLDFEDDEYVDMEVQGAFEAYQAGRAALQSQGREDDPLQPAANWLIQAIENCGVTDIQSGLRIAYNRAQRLFDHARLACGGNHE